MPNSFQVSRDGIEYCVPVFFSASKKAPGGPNADLYGEEMGGTIRISCHA